jgi:hypothetical protein
VSRKEQTVNSEGYAMTGGARLFAESSPQRVRDHGDDPQFIAEDGSDSVLWALCVSVVEIYAKQSQFADKGIHFNIFVAQELCEIALETRREKQSQFHGLAQPGKRCARQHPACGQTGSQPSAFHHFVSQTGLGLHYIARTVILGRGPRRERVRWGAQFGEVSDDGK